MRAAHYENPETPTLFLKPFLSWTNSEVQTFLPLVVVDDSTRWELDDYFKLTKERATVLVSVATASDLLSTVTFSAAVGNLFCFTALTSPTVSGYPSQCKHALNYDTKYYS